MAAILVLATLFGAVGGSLATWAVANIRAPSRAVAAPNAHLGETVAQLSAQLTALKTDVAASDHAVGARVSKLAQAVDRLDHRTPTHATTDITGSLPAQRQAVANPAAKRAPSPPIVRGWVLRAVNDGAALVEGRFGLVEVEPGDELPGLGRIETIRRQGGRWAVLTSRGLIVE